jgi:hypothetical protein
MSPEALDSLMATLNSTGDVSINLKVFIKPKNNLKKAYNFCPVFYQMHGRNDSNGKPIYHFCSCAILVICFLLKTAQRREVK